MVLGAAGTSGVVAVGETDSGFFCKGSTRFTSEALGEAELGTTGAGISVAFGFGAPRKAAESSGGGTIEEPPVVVGATGDVGRDATGASGATNFGATTFASTLVLTGAGAAGFAAPLLGALFAEGSPILGAAARAATCEPFEAAGRTAAGVGWGAEPIRSLGKRIPQKPTAGSVNSNSTYPLMFR